MLSDDDTWVQVYKQSNPNKNFTSVQGLVAGKLYKFRAFAFDFNG